MNFLVIRYFIILLICSQSCQTSKKKISKNFTDSPFIETAVTSQFFDINTQQDTVIEGDKGLIIVLPKGCFIDKSGKPIQKQVKVELAEVLSNADLLKTGLGASEIAENEGVYYLNMTSGEREVSINPDIPITISIPTDKRKGKVKFYEGVWDKKGGIKWKNAKKPETYLTTVNLEDLDFYPKNFEKLVEEQIPFRGHLTASKKLKDSLFYALPLLNSDNRWKFLSHDYNEALYNSHQQVVDGKYTDDSFSTEKTVEEPATWETPIEDCFGVGIDPTKIKVIRSKKFQNTWIATREFESRLKQIYQTGQNSILDLYVNNTDKNLWELDSMVLDMLCKESCVREEFQKFKNQKLTTVKAGGKSAKLLRKYYAKQYQKLKKKLKINKIAYEKALQKDRDKVAQKAQEYKQVLWKREKYRMERYACEWTKKGWVTARRGEIVAKLTPLEVEIQNPLSFDEIYVYVNYDHLKSLYRLNTVTQKLFYVGNGKSHEMFMPILKPATVFALGFKDSKRYFIQKEFVTGEITKIKLKLSEVNLEEFKSILKKLGDKNDRSENRIITDLNYQKQFTKARKKEQKRFQEWLFLKNLKYTLYTDCRRIPAYHIRELFKAHCQTCHAIKTPFVGPALDKILSRRGLWLGVLNLYVTLKK